MQAHHGSYNKSQRGEKEDNKDKKNHQPLADAPEECALSLSPSYLRAERLGWIVGVDPLTDPFTDPLTEDGADMVIGLKQIEVCAQYGVMKW